MHVIQISVDWPCVTDLSRTLALGSRCSDNHDTSNYGALGEGVKATSYASGPSA